MPTHPSSPFSHAHTRMHHQPDSSPPGLAQWACYKRLTVWVQSWLPLPEGYIHTYIHLAHKRNSFPEFCELWSGDSTIPCGDCISPIHLFILCLMLLSNFAQTDLWCWKLYFCCYCDIIGILELTGKYPYCYWCSCTFDWSLTGWSCGVVSCSQIMSALVSCMNSCLGQIFIV